MTDQSVDLLSGETAVSENGTGGGEQQQQQGSSDAATPAAASVDLLGFGDEIPAAAAAAPPVTQTTFDFDVFASPATGLVNGGNDSTAAAAQPIVPPLEQQQIAPTEEKSSPEPPVADNLQSTQIGEPLQAETPATTTTVAAETPPTESTDSTVAEAAAAAAPNGDRAPANSDTTMTTTTETAAPPLSQSTQDNAEDTTVTNASGETPKDDDATPSPAVVGDEESASPPPPPPETEMMRSRNEPTPPATASLLDSANDMDELRAELQETKAKLERLQNEQARRMEDDGALLMELQSKLQEHMSARAEAENKVRLTEQSLQLSKQKNEEQAQELQQYREMEDNWQGQKTVQAEMENDFRDAKKQIGKIEEEKEALRELILNLEKEVEDLQRERMNQEEELKAIREQRDEQERREIALTNRLNAAKKKEADKANLAEHFEDEMKALRDDAKQAKEQVEELIAAKESLEHELARTKTSSDSRTRQAEIALADEKRLNEDRKGKMKAFIEKKSEELRQAKADADSLRTELNQTSRSLVDLNNRWKQLHAQWVQSQTRNRELQRDLNRIKKDSENLHKVGDTLEMKLSRSATETEEHKNKRLAAKNELMTVLKTLEAEREVSARLRDAIKFTFIPKALSQQQLLKENLEDLERELVRLSRRFGKPLPPVSGGGLDVSEAGVSVDSASLGEDGKGSRTDSDIQRLIGKLDHETQGVSQHIMALSGEIERLHSLIDVSGNRNCYTALSDIILGASHVASTGDNGTGGGESSIPLRAIRSHDYGQVPSNAAT